jgi:hypothetical protein
MEQASLLNHLYQLNNSVKSYKKNDNLSNLIDTNEKYLNYMTLNMIGGSCSGPHAVCFSKMIEKSMQEIISSINTKCTGSGSSCNVDEYNKVITYLSYNLKLLSIMFSDKQLTTLQNQVGELEKIMKDATTSISPSTQLTSTQLEQVANPPPIIIPVSTQTTPTAGPTGTTGTRGRQFVVKSTNTSTIPTK